MPLCGYKIPVCPTAGKTPPIMPSMQFVHTGEDFFVFPGKFGVP